MSRDRILCPFHEESTPSCVLYEEKYHCFGCGKTGSLEDIGKERKYEPKREDKEDIKESIKRIKLLPVDNIRGLSLPCDDISYYIIWPGGTYYKRRFKVDGKAKYINPKGHPAPLFWANKKGTYDLNIVEGEINALSLSLASYNDTCSPGSANDLYSEKYLKEYVKYQRITIYADEDVPGAVGAITLKKKLFDLGHTNVKIDLMTVDFNYLLVNYGKNILQKYILAM